MGPMGKALGMGKKPMLGADEEETDYEDPAEEEGEGEDPGGVPAEFESAYSDYEENPNSSTMYAMIQACHGESQSKPGGLELILGGKKDK